MSLSRIVLGMNSFRCSEALIGGLFGVSYTRIGYAGGSITNPSFQHIGNYTEVVEAHYDKSVISLSDILDVFFENHDYTTLYPKRYASAIYYTEDAQREEAESVIKYTLTGDVATTILPLYNYVDAEHMFHKYYLQNTPTVMLQLLYEYNWDIRTWFSEFNVLPFVTKLNACLSGLYDMDYVGQILDSINVPDNIKLECKLRASRTRPQCLFL